MALRAISGAALRKVISANDETVFTGSLVTIRDVVTGTLASLYEDNAGATPKNNPFTADNTGQFIVYAQPDLYDVTIENAGLTASGVIDINPADLEVIRHINDFIAVSATHVLALENACLNCTKLLFGGATLTLESDFNYPSGGTCTEFDGQGGRVNLANNSQFIFPAANIGSTDVTTRGIVFDGNAKTALITTKTGNYPSSVTVGAHTLQAGDHIAASWSNSFLPNSEGRVGAGKELPVLNTVASATASTINFTYPLRPVTIAGTETTDTTTASYTDGDRVHQSTSNLYYEAITNTTPPDSLTDITKFKLVDTTLGRDVDAGFRSILPQNAVLSNARFDKVNVEYQGTGHFHVEDCVFQNMANAYAISVNDSTETATSSWINCTIQTIMLDAANFRGSKLHLDRLKIRDVVDIAKQCVVWNNSLVKGRLTAIDCDFEPSNIDAFLYANGTDGRGLGYLPDRTFINCRFDGYSTRNYIPRQLYNLSARNFEGRSGSFDNLIGGKAQFTECDFISFTRHGIGTTFSNANAWKQEPVAFDTCRLDCDGVYFERAGSANIMNVSPVTYNNCTIKGTVFKLGRGAGDIQYNNCLLLQQMSTLEDAYTTDGTEFEEATDVTTRVYYQGEVVIPRSEGDVWQADETTVISDNIRTSGKFTNIGRAFYVENSATTTRDYNFGDVIFRTDNIRYYRCIAGGLYQYGTESGDSLTNGDLFENTSCIIDRGSFNQCKFVGEWDFKDANNVVLHDCIFPKRDGDTMPDFEFIFQEGIDNTLVIEDVDNTDTTALDLDYWFTASDAETDTPNFKIKVKNSDLVIQYGQDEAASREFIYLLKSRRFDPDVGSTAPLPMKGAVVVDPKENSLVSAVRSPGLTERITFTTSATVNELSSVTATETSNATTSNYTAGDTIRQSTSAKDYIAIVNTTIGDSLTDSNKFLGAIEISGTSTTPQLGHWISIVNSGASTVYFYEIVGISGSVYTISPNLKDEMVGETGQTAFLIGHEPLYPINKKIRLEANTGTQNYTTTGSYTDDIVFDSEESNTIPYASFDGTSTVTLPAGKYNFYCDVNLETPAGQPTGLQTLNCSLRLSSNAAGWSDVQGAACSSSSNDSTDNWRLHSNPNVFGSFEISNEADFTVELYTSRAVRTTSTSNLLGAVLEFIKVG